MADGSIFLLCQIYFNWFQIMAFWFHVIVCDIQVYRIIGEYVWLKIISSVLPFDLIINVPVIVIISLFHCNNLVLNLSLTTWQIHYLGLWLVCHTMVDLLMVAGDTNHSHWEDVWETLSAVMCGMLDHSSRYWSIFVYPETGRWMEIVLACWGHDNQCWKLLLTQL